MIKKLETGDCVQTRSHVHGRRGLQHVSSVIERLIRIYQLQSEMGEVVDESSKEIVEGRDPRVAELVPVDAMPTQATFGWD